MDFGRSLHQAVLDRNHARVDRLLAGKDPNPNQADQAGFTPLLYAVRVGDLWIARRLVAAGACVNAKVCSCC
ncbi:hypothetical protein HDV03_002972 [Kappamyces sp. JEL0829]|nr:hypothetical protein HDV03_002972 [Kappamyces sp. JEL0829]